MTRPVRLPAFVRSLCANYAWPGNLREMENVLERVAVSHAGRKIGRKELELELEITVPELYGGTDEAAPADPDGAAFASLDEIARTSQAAHARRVLDACHGDRAAACRILGISPATLWRKLKEAPTGAP